MPTSAAAAAAPSSSQSGHRLGRFIIRLLLRMERAALETMGSEESLLMIDQHPVSASIMEPTLDGRDDIMISPVSTETPLFSESDPLMKHNFRSEDSPTLPKYLILPSRWYFRYLVNLLLLSLFTVIEAGYYVCQTRLVTVEPSVRTLLRLEIITLPILLSFWFAAPMHTALGYFTKNAELTDCRLNQDKLLSDSGAHFLVKFTLLMALFMSTAEALLWTSRWQGKPTQDAFYVLYVLFPVLRVIHLITFLLPLLLIALSLRGITARLKEIDDELDVDLNVLQQTKYASVHPQHSKMLRRWSESYYRLGQDIGNLSERFGLRMVWGLGLLVVETANIISLVWTSSKDRMTPFETAMVLIVYVANSSMLMVSVSSICFPVTVCTQDIGPKLAVMAIREQGKDVTSTAGQTTRICQVLANAFLLAPIEMHVGNLEILPSVANAVGGVLVGLFLVALGYDVPTA